MSRTEILTRFSEIIKELTGNNDIVISEETAAGEVEGWDSLMHINILVGLEREYGIAFPMEEVVDSKKVGDFIDLIVTAKKT